MFSGKLLITDDMIANFIGQQKPLGQTEINETRKKKPSYKK